MTDLVGAYQVAPKVIGHKSYNGTGEESHPHCYSNKGFGAFLMVGETGFVEDRSAKIFLVKTDLRGKLLYKKNLEREDIIWEIV